MSSFNDFRVPDIRVPDIGVPDIGVPDIIPSEFCWVAGELRSFGMADTTNVSVIAALTHRTPTHIFVLSTS